MKAFNLLRASIFPIYLGVCLGVLGAHVAVFAFLLPMTN